MSARRQAVVFGVLAALIHNTSFAELNEAGKALLQQGRYWYSQNDSARAAEVWRKLLLIDPQQVDALYGLGLLEVRARNLTGANYYLNQLRQFHPGLQQTLELEQTISVQSPENVQLLENAKAAAEAGDLDKAIASYRQVFAGRVPQGDLALEFYSYLGYTKSGWSEARQGLTRLQQQSPRDDRIKLNLAKLLISNESTRADGIRRLVQLSKVPSTSGEAIENWRIALVWLGSSPRAADLPLLEEFLKSYPDDKEIRGQLNRGRQQLVNAAGLRMLENGDQAGAEKAFLARLEVNSDDPDALGGLGVVRQQQKLFADAEQLLMRAVNNGGARWKTALDGVRYWMLLQKARDLQAEGQVVKAKDVIAQAMRLNPSGVDGRLALADMQAQAGELDAAESVYRDVLISDRANPQAIRGLVAVLGQTGRPEEALRLLDNLSSAEQAKFGDPKRLRSLRAIQVANLAEQRDDSQGMLKALTDALRDDPDNVWTRMRLARLYLKSGNAQKAQDLIDSYIKANPDNVEASYTRALLAVEMEQWKEAQQIINRIPVGRRTADMNNLSDQVALTIQVNLAVSIAKRGQRQEALAMLDRLQLMAGGNIERTVILASAYADAGEPDKAKSLMRAQLNRFSTPSAELMLQYGSILLKTDDDVQVHSLLLSLQNERMSVANRKRYDDLLNLYRIRQADRLREAGNLVAAYDTLSPALMQHPDDVATISALARMYTSNGDNVKAFDLYKPLLQRNPNDAGLLLSTADAAARVQDRAYAEDLLERFVKSDKSEPDSLAEAARIYQSIGKTKEASELLRRAVAIEKNARQQSFSAEARGVVPAVNPFLPQSASRSSSTVIPLPAESILNAGSGTTSKEYVSTAASQAQRRGGVPPVASTYTVSPFEPVSPAVTARSPSIASDQNAKRLAIETSSTSRAQRALDDMVQARSGYVAQGLNIRSNNSESGLSKLTDVQLPVEVNLPVGENRLALRITPVLLSSGGMSAEAATRFGDTSVASSAVGTQRDEGVGISLAYELKGMGLKADIGTTPIGFEYNNVVGGVSIDRPWEENSNVRYGLAVSRRAVTDSLVSFAGTTVAPNPSPYIGSGTTQLSWGGVTANGLRAQLGYDDSEVGAYVYGSVHRLIGNNVKSNTRAELGGGAYRYLISRPDTKLTAGVGTTILGFANNQSFFTYGHGGYFSPQTYVSFGVPVTWSQRSDRFTYQLKGTLGLQYFQQDGVDYFPTDAVAQALINKRYEEQSNSGVGYKVEAAGEYRFGPKLFVGGMFALDNSRDYKQYNVGMYLRYMFENMTGSPMALPVSPYRSPY